MCTDNALKDRIATNFEAQWKFVGEYRRHDLPPEEFSDLLAQDLENVTECRKELDRWRYSFDRRRCTTLPELTQIAEQCEALDHSLREKACDFEVLGKDHLDHDEYVNAVWDELLPLVSKLRDCLAEYGVAILRSNQEDGLVGCMERHGKAYRASWYEFPEDEHSQERERIERHFFRTQSLGGDSKARRPYPVQKATYFLKETNASDVFKSLGFSRQRMKKQSSALPRLVKPLARLQYGHRADGVGEHVLVFLIGDYVISGQRVPSKAPPRVKKPKPKPTKQSLWSALRGFRYLILIGLLGVGSIYLPRYSPIEPHEVVGEVADALETTFERLDDLRWVASND